MLNRALLEDALSVHWVAADTDEVVGAQADKHDRATSLGERKLFARFGRSVGDGPLSPTAEADFQKLEKDFEGFSCPGLEQSRERSKHWPRRAGQPRRAARSTHL